MLMRKACTNNTTRAIRIVMASILNWFGTLGTYSKLNAMHTQGRISGKCMTEFKSNLPCQYFQGALVLLQNKNIKNQNDFYEKLRIYFSLCKTSFINYHYQAKFKEEINRNNNHAILIWPNDSIFNMPH
jgi:hypothetical protein